MMEEKNISNIFRKIGEDITMKQYLKVIQRKEILEILNKTFIEIIK